jgi:hypothetical protein
METSMEYDTKIEEWYTIPVEAREQMVASVLAKRWIENLMAQDVAK